MNMANYMMTPKLRAELERLALLRDDEIDVSDIPEALDWSKAQRGRFAPERIVQRSYDVRAIANWFLEHAKAVKMTYSNMSLNKLVYFAFERSLVDRNVLLTPARIEAWAHGPVFRELYQAFQSASDGPISGKATRFSVNERAMVEATEQFEQADEEFFETILLKYGRLSATRLRAISHAKDSPWDVVWHYRGQSNPGMEITPIIIFEHAPQWRLSDEI